MSHQEERHRPLGSTPVPTRLLPGLRQAPTPKAEGHSGGGAMGGAGKVPPWQGHGARPCTLSLLAPGPTCSSLLPGTQETYESLGPSLSPRTEAEEEEPRWGDPRAPRFPLGLGTSHQAPHLPRGHRAWAQSPSMPVSRARAVLGVDPAALTKHSPSLPGGSEPGRTSPFPARLFLETAGHLLSGPRIPFCFALWEARVT